INTRPQKGKDGLALARVRNGMLLLSALVFFAIALYSLLRLRDVDGLLFLALGLCCATGGLLHKRLNRRNVIAALYCVVLAAFVLASMALGEYGLLTAIWALFFPVIAVSVCGLRNGGIIGLLLGVGIDVLFYTPVLGMVPAAYPEEIVRFYPVIYGLIFIVICLYSYLQHRRLLNQQQYEETLEKAVKTERDHLMVMMTQTILSISNAVDARDAYTRRHSARVAEYSVMLARELGWDKQRLDQLYSIALLHDIGKIGISDTILNKHAALTPEEREIICQHTVIGGEILKDLTLLPNASIGAVGHHECYDGTGYPYGLKGGQIPIEARIIGIADAFDAMNSSRVYRARIAPQRIMQELRDGRGRQFDPDLLDRFLPLAEEILQADEI
ncbi:MAG: HD-GYP domain-containing protein, partial [Candidatus Spyradocola sp.]